MKRYAVVFVRFIGCVGLLAVIFCAVHALGPASNLDNAKSVPEYLKSISVIVRTESGHGSGYVIVRDVKGAKTAFVWTAAHVIAHTSQATIYVPSTKVTRQCDLIAADDEHDIALLRVRGPNIFKNSAEFPLHREEPSIGTELYMCGSPIDEHMENTITNGIIACLDREFNGFIFYQTTCPTLSGGSGGITALKDSGRLVGMFTIGYRGGDSFTFIIPARRLVAWAMSRNLRWAVDPSVPVPDLKPIAFETEDEQ